MKRLLWIKNVLVLFFGIFLIISLYSCGGNSSSTYTLPEGNHALMGPLKDATVKIYKLSDLNRPIETTTTGNLGSFSVSLKGVPDDELLLVQVSGGYDIDSNDDGVLDINPVKNYGTISAYATAGELRSGKVNVTLLSEIVYNYSLSSVKGLKDGTLSKYDFEGILGRIASSLIAADNFTQAYKDIISFNPLSASSKNKLKFKYSELLKGDNCLASLYHEDDIENIPNELNKLFAGHGLVLDDAVWFYLRKQAKVNVIWSPCISGVTVKVNGDLNNQNNTTAVRQRSFFVDKSDNITVQVNSIDGNYKILRWHGCDRVSSDKNTCYVYDIQKDRIITPVTVPSKFTFSSDYAVVDITGAYVKLPKVGDNSSIDLKNIPLNSDLLDEIIAYANSSDNSTMQKLSSVKVGDIITHTSNPIFFRKVTKVQSTNVPGGVKYDFETTFIPLEDIIKSGYISTSANTAGSGSANVRVVSKSLVLPNGQEIQFDPNSQPEIVIKFKGDKAYIHVGEKRDWHMEINDISFSEGPIYLDKNKDIKLEGTFTIKPHLDFDISWAQDHWYSAPYIDFFHFSSGSKYSADVKLSFTKKAEIGVPPTELFNALDFHETVFIGAPPLVVPVLITETMPIIYGIKGPGVGAGEDKASVEGELSADAGISFDPTFSVTSNGDGTVANFAFNPGVHGSIGVKVSAGAYAYIGAVPTVKVYFFGLKMTNDIGPYAKIEAKASASTCEGAKAELSGSFGLGYYGRIEVTADGNVGFINNMVDNINKVIRGKYTEFWNPFPIKTFSYESSSMATPMGYLKVMSGPKELFYEKNWSDNLNETVSYTVKNTGIEAISWQADVINHSGGVFSIKVSPQKGKLSPGETKNVTVTLSSATLPENGGIFKAELVFHKVLDSSAPTLPFHVVPIVVKVAPDIGTNTTLSTDLSVSIENATVKKLKFNWTPVNANIDGYTIFYSEYDNSTGKCSDDYRSFASISNKSSNSYSQVISFSKVRPGQKYCFTIFAYKMIGNNLNGRYYFHLLQTPVVSPTIPSSISDWQ